MSVQSVFISVDDGRRWFEMTPASRFDSTIVQLIPLSGPSLAVLFVTPFGSPLVSLEVSPALISGLDSADAGTRAATARALGASGSSSPCTSARFTSRLASGLPKGTTSKTASNWPLERDQLCDSLVEASAPVSSRTTTSHRRR